MELKKYGCLRIRKKKPIWIPGSQRYRLASVLLMVLLLCGRDPFVVSWG